MKAILKNYRQSPRKVRLVADSVKGKSVDEALTRLKFMPKRATDVIGKLIASAAANARENFDNAGELIVKNIEVNKGVTLKRYRPRARGSAFRINKRTSNLVVTLAEKTEKKPKVKESGVETIKKPQVKKAVEKSASKNLPDRKRAGVAEKKVSETSK
jgi:large subunit ribosomal protein L22